MAMLRYGLDRLGDKDGPFNLSVRDVVLWRMVRLQVAHLDFEELREAIEDDDQTFADQHFTEEYLIDGVYSRDGYQFYSTRVHPKGSLAKRSHYVELLADWDSKPRPAVAVLDATELALTNTPITVTLSNQGFGGAQALDLNSIEVPDWVTLTRRDHELDISSNVQTPGVYHGIVELHTNGGTAKLIVTAERLDFPIPDSDYVVVDSFFTPSAGMDIGATRLRVEEYLRELGFELLPGGAAVQLEVRPISVERFHVRLQPTYIQVGEVPLPHRIDAHPKLVDEDGFDPGYAPVYNGGVLSGLRDLFVDYDAKPGQHLVLRTLSDGYEFRLEDPDPLIETHGFRYWLIGPAPTLAAINDWEQLLRAWAYRGEVNVLVGQWEDNPLTETLARLHRSGTASVKTFEGKVPCMLVVEGETTVILDPIQRKPTHIATSHIFLWRQGEFLDGKNVREAAESSSEGDGLVLPLSPEQHRLAALLRPMPKPQGPPEQLLAKLGMVEPTAVLPKDSRAERFGPERWWFKDRETYLSLIRLSTEYLGALQKNEDTWFLPAQRLLKEFGLNADQVNLFDRPLVVTSGGFLAKDPAGETLTKVAAAVVALTAEPLHHSQLRQLCGAYLGTDIEHGAFLQASLKACGWAGPGYRRAKVKNEPTGTNLPDVVRSLLTMGHLKRHEVIIAARRYLRVSSERIAKTYDSVIRASLDKL